MTQPVAALFRRCVPSSSIACGFVSAVTCDPVGLRTLGRMNTGRVCADDHGSAKRFD